MRSKRILFVLVGIGALAAGSPAGFADSRQAVPDAEAQKAALDDIRELYKDEYRNAKTSAQRIALAKKLVQHAIEFKNDAAGQFSLLRVAKDIALKADDAPTTVAAIDAMAARFQVDGLQMTSSALVRIVRGPISPESRRRAIASLRELTQRAIAADRYELAASLADLGVIQTKKIRDGNLLKQLSAERQRVAKLAEQFKKVRTALLALSSDPTDPTANLTVGRYRCLVKGDWEAGLPMLALGNHAKLKALALAELKTSRTPAEEAALGDAWWEWAEANAGGDAAQIKQHAAQRYRAAAGKLRGLSKVRVEKRLASLRAAAEKLARKSSGRRRGDKKKQDSDHKWLPLDEGGNLTHCLKLGPFPRTAVNHRNILLYLSKGEFDKEVFGTKPSLDQAREPNKSAGRSGYEFTGPAQKQTDHVMYYLFYVKSDVDQRVNLRAGTFTRWRHSTVSVALDFRPIPNAGDIPLSKGSHTILVMQHHMKSDRPGRSWVTLAIRGKGIQQAAPVKAAKVP